MKRPDLARGRRLVTIFAVHDAVRPQQIAVAASRCGCGDTRTGFQIEEVGWRQIDLAALGGKQQGLGVLMRDVSASAVSILGVGPFVDPRLRASGQPRHAGNAAALVDDMLCRVHAQHTSKIEILKSRFAVPSGTRPESLPWQSSAFCPPFTSKGMLWHSALLRNFHFGIFLLDTILRFWKCPAIGSDT